MLYTNLYWHMRAPYQTEHTQTKNSNFCGHERARSSLRRQKGTTPQVGEISWMPSLAAKPRAVYKCSKVTYSQEVLGIEAFLIHCPSNRLHVETSFRNPIVVHHLAH